MPVILADTEIAALVAEPKRLPADFYNRIAPRVQKRGHSGAEIQLVGELGSQFVVLTRMADMNQLDFSVILAVELPETKALFRLRRYNGRTHEHTNRIERQRIGGFHIHYATERYQAMGTWEDGYAVPTVRYADFWGAVNCMVEDCSCQAYSDPNRLPF